MTDERPRLRSLKDNLELRASIYHLTRLFFREQGFLEVEPPIRVPAVAPELNLVPFASEGWYLSTSPELYMKRLLAAGYDRLFQISHCFRQEERGRLHNPEFSLLEWYRAGADYLQVIEDTEHLVATVSRRLRHSLTIRYRGQRIDISHPWPRLTVREAFRSAAGWDPVAQPDPLRFDTDLVTRVLPSFPANRPTVLLDYPAPMASLARLKKDDQGVAERAEVFLGGLELANAYSELIDPQEQERRFREEIAQIQREQGRQAPMPEHFLEAVAHLPECSGIALGMDRLVMLFCNAESIEEVVPFTVDTA